MPAHPDAPLGASQLGPLQHCVDHAPVAVAMFDARMCYLAASSSWRRDYDLPDAPLNGTSFYERLPETPAAWKEIHQRCLAGASHYAPEDLLVRRDGRRQWLRWGVSPWYDAAGSVAGVLVFSEDVSERKQAQADLRDSERRRHDSVETARALLETAAQGIVLVDNAGKVVQANAAMASMFGYQPGEIEGHPVEVLVPGALRGNHEQHRARYRAAPFARTMGDGLNLAGQRKDGTTFPIEVSLNHAATPDGDMVMAFVTDITSRRQAEEALKASHAQLQMHAHDLQWQADKLRDLATELTAAEQRVRERLARTLHDDLQQLLFSAALKLDRLLGGAADRSGEERALIERVRADMKDAIAAARSLSAELFPPVLHDSSLATALAWLARWFDEKYGLKVDATLDERANPSVKEMRTILFETVRELLFNIVKHAGVARATLTLGLDPTGQVEIVVQDEGNGFSAETILTERTSRGQGLGLAGIRERLRLLGGSLRVDSAPGRGARFRLTSPLDPARPRTVMAEDPPNPAARVSILIADDHAFVRQGLRELLSERPELHVVGEAADGIEAIEKAHALHPDVVLMDVSMPRLDGIEATRRICRELPAVVVFGLSTHERTRELHAIERAGASGYFTKGDDAQRLVEELVRVWDARRERSHDRSQAG